MTKSELIDRLAARLPHLTHRDVELAVRSMLELMSRSLAEGERIEVRGFGSFSLRFRPSRMAATREPEPRWPFRTSTWFISSRAGPCASASTMARAAIPPRPDDGPQSRRKMMFELLWLLLPVAAASGWYAARRSEGGGRRRLTPDYFRGLHYLLNDQPDRAIEVFIKVLEIDEETAETQLALGNLYRRRGEVDRAIRLHQNLVARPALTDDLRLEAHLELAQDYLSAGVLDRAEDIYRDLVGAKAHRVQALRHLLDIYEQEKDWEQARSTALELADATGTEQGAVVSQYLCEGALKALTLGDKDEALVLLRAAREAHPACARASLHEGDILSSRGRYDQALAAYRRIEDQDADYLPEAIGRIQKCFEKLGRREAARGYLERILERYGGMTVMLALADMIREERGNTSAIHFMLEALAKRPTVRGFERLLEFASASAAVPASAEVPDHLDVMKGLLAQLMNDRPVYQCRHCGFAARSLHWQCPGCKHWNTVRPVRGVEGE